MNETLKKRRHWMGGCIAACGLVCVTLLLPGCWLRRAFEMNVAQYSDGVKFMGNDADQDKVISRVQWTRQMPNQEIPIAVEVGGRTFGHDDLQFERFQAVGAKVPVSKYTSIEDNHTKVRKHELHGNLQLTGKNFRLWCAYDNLGPTFVDLFVYDPDRLPNDAKAFSVEWNGKRVGLPCSVEKLKAELGEPESFYTYNIGM